LSFLKAHLRLFPQVPPVRGSAAFQPRAQPGQSCRIFRALCSACISPLDEAVLNTNTSAKYFQVLQKSPPPRDDRAYASPRCNTDCPRGRRSHPPRLGFTLPPCQRLSVRGSKRKSCVCGLDFKPLFLTA